MKASEVITYAAAGVAAYVGYKAYKKVAGQISGAADGAKKIAAAAVEVINTDLNPASDQNVVYTGINALGRVATNDPGFNLGNKLWEVTHREQVAKEKGLTNPGQQQSNVQEQAAVMQQRQEDFRRSEIQQEDSAAAAEAAAADTAERKKSDFRISEINTQSGYQSGPFENFLYSLQKTLYGGPVAAN